jgi:hypothetical protein
LQNRVNIILKKFPNILEEKNENVLEYYKYIGFMKEIKGLNDFIIESNNQKKTFFHNLDFEDKILLSNKLVLELKDGKLSNDELSNKIKIYRIKSDLLYDAKYPLNDKIDELIKDKDSSLARYLLENKDIIDRLTVISNSETISEMNSRKVTKIEYKLVEKRVERFTKYTKEAGINDIVSNDGFFDDKKVYYNKENFVVFFYKNKNIYLNILNIILFVTLL